MRYQAQAIGELSDEEIENAAGGTLKYTLTPAYTPGLTIATPGLLTQEVTKKL